MMSIRAPSTAAMLVGGPSLPSRRPVAPRPAAGLAVRRPATPSLARRGPAARAERRLATRAAASAGKPLSTAELVLAGDVPPPAGTPDDIATAIRLGTMPVDVLARYLRMRKNPLLATLLSYAGFRSRLLADANFLIKVAIELGIGVAMKVTAEYAKRGDKFGQQLDFVFANIVMALVADWMLVWLPAPTFDPLHAAHAGEAAGEAAGAGAGNALARFFAGCPENAFQRVPEGYEPFSLLQRVGAAVRNGIKLGVVGCGASLLGVGVTNGIGLLRARLDPTYVPLNAPQNVLVMSLAYGAYMATSANLRYQVVAGILEERGIETIFKNYPNVCAALSFVVRTGNTFVGSLLWVDFLRFFNLQPKA